MNIDVFSICLLICSLPLLNGIWDLTRFRRKFYDLIRDKIVIMSFVMDIILCIISFILWN